MSQVAGVLPDAEDQASDGPRAAQVRSDRLAAIARRHLPVVHFALDATLWALAIPLAVWMRFDFESGHFNAGVALAVAVAVVLQGVFGLVSGLYRRRWRYGSFDEIAAIGVTALATGLVLTSVLWRDTDTPRSVPALAFPLALLGQVAVRATWRSWVQGRRRPVPRAIRTVVVGAGEGASTIVRTMVTGGGSRYVPVALVDDDRDKRNLRLSGVRVEGTLDDLDEVATRHGAEAVLLAIPSAGSELYRRVDRLGRALDLEVLVLPPIDQLIGPIRVADIRPLAPEDLLGRRVAEIDARSIADYVTGRRVLVTGAGGSIGSELCRQLHAFAPDQLLLLDRDENGLHATQLSIDGSASLTSPPLVLADIRDAERLDEVFRTLRPEIVFHAAALKHLPILDASPTEGWKTNVLGTLQLLDASSRHGVERFVNISTDKAANPTGVLGWTKRITERITADFGVRTDMHCVSVRFGNVLGTAGSVMKVFEAQAADGLPITVTHPEMTRYFMTVGEAARLVIQAGAIGESGEVLILDMGEPVQILEVAKRFAAQHEPPLEVVFTGLRGSEKMHEELFGDGEVGETRCHRLITHVGVAPLPRERVVDRPPPDDLDGIRRCAAGDSESLFGAS